MRHWIELYEGTNIGPTFPYPYLYHATANENVPSIRDTGLLTKYYKMVHGGMEMHPPKPAVYLSRRITSNNLNAQLFVRGPISVLTIDASLLDKNEMYPDDFLYDMVAERDIFKSAGSVAKALGCPHEEAKAIFAQIEKATAKQLPAVMKPFWLWYLKWRKGGEIAYTQDIPPELILDVRPLVN